MCAHFGIIRAVAGKGPLNITKGNIMANRKGKHKDGNVRMGVYVQPFRKAVAVYLAKTLGKTMTDIIWEGIERLAITNGILTPDGKVTAKFRAEIAAAEEIVRQSEVKG